MIWANKDWLGFSRSADFSANLTAPSASSHSSAKAVLVDMISYKQYGICQFAVAGRSSAAEDISGSVKVDQKEDKESKEWSFSNPAPYALPLGSMSTRNDVALGFSILSGLAMALIHMS